MVPPHIFYPSVGTPSAAITPKHKQTMPCPPTFTKNSSTLATSLAEEPYRVSMDVYISAIDNYVELLSVAFFMSDQRTASATWDLV